MTTDIIVIDVSHHQDWPAGKPFPWDMLTDAGIVGAILKATEGTSYLDPTYHERKGALQDHGVAVSSYHFLRPGSLPQQMDWFLKTAAPVPGERLVLDWEDGGVHVGDVEYCVNYLLSKRPDLQLTVYASSSFLQENVVGAHDTLAKTSLWVARYSSQEPYWPTQVWPTWTLWQCTDSFSIGDYGPLDGNKFNGSVENCIAWLNPAVQKPGPTPEPEPDKAVMIDIQVSSGVAVAVRVNDSDWKPA